MSTAPAQPAGFPPQELHIDPREFGLRKVAYSVKETSEVLSIARSSLYRLVGDGALNPVKMGTKTLFFATDLAAFLSRLQRAA